MQQTANALMHSKWHRERLLLYSTNLLEKVFPLHYKLSDCVDEMCEKQSKKITIEILRVNIEFLHTHRERQTYIEIHALHQHVSMWMCLILLFWVNHICICKNFNLVLVNVCTILWIYPKKVLFNGTSRLYGTDGDAIPTTSSYAFSQFQMLYIHIMLGKT